MKFVFLAAVLFASPAFAQVETQSYQIQPVSIMSSVSLPVSVANFPATQVTAAAGPVNTSDIVSTARTASGVSAAFSPGSIAQSYAVNVSAVSGTAPVLDLALQESWDLGVSWQSVYQIERVTASTASAITTPMMRLTGNRYRWAWTISGTSPSFTFAIARNSSSANAGVYRRFFDRTISPSTLNSTTAVFRIEECNRVAYGVQITASGFSPSFELQVSEDGVTFSDAAITLNILSAFQQGYANSSNINAKFARIRTSGTGLGSATLNYAWIRCQGQ